MNKRLFSIAIIAVMILGTFFYAGGPVGRVQAETTTLAGFAGISAWGEASELDYEGAKSKFLAIEYEAAGYFIGTFDMDPYEAEYDPYVLVTEAGKVVAFYPAEDPAAKIADVMSRSAIGDTLLEKAVKAVAGDVAVTHFDFANPTATTLALIGEYQADGDSFTLTLPAETEFEKSYGFYRSYEPSFTLDSDLIDQVNFVLVNAKYIGAGVYGTIFGDFASTVFAPDVPYTFTVWNRDFYAFGALALEYSGEPVITVADADYERYLNLVVPGTLGTTLFDLWPTAFGKSSPLDAVTGEVLNPVLSWADSSAPNYEYCIDTSVPDSDPLTDDCGTDWVSTGSATSVALGDLFYETTYYWQVRAVNSTATVEANAGAWWSFTTADGVAPVAFDIIGAALVEKLGSPSKVTLSWEPSYGAYYYEYCVDTTADCVAPEVWHNVGLEETVTVSVAFDTTYFWQVRAVNDFGTVEADGEWGTFETRNFSKLSPTDGLVLGTFNSAPLEWEATGPATGYEYCLSTTDLTCPTGGWKTVKIGTRVTVKALTAETTYYWQVRAKTKDGDIEANDGDWWSFTTAPRKLAIPMLSKVSPVDGAVIDILTPTLDWKDYTKSFISYEYCFFDIDDTDTTPISDDDTCTLYDENWVDAAKVSAVLIANPLDDATTYHWQVRVNIGTVTVPKYVYGDQGAYWAFTTPE